ncbi:methylase [Xylariomycetidae sp. FL0641]|nr:methylase [Xylariomycetidae sp. FL0641]
MARNIYEDPEFLTKLAELSADVGKISEGVPDVLNIEALLPSLKAARVLDLGCGDGWFSRWAIDRGAASVYAVDRSTSMVATAKRCSETDRPCGYDKITYAVANLDEPVGKLGPAKTQYEAQYDVVFSSLTFHYLTDLPTLFREVRKVLRPGGAFVFSVEHPMRTATRQPGMRTDESGNAFWPVTHYSDEGERVTNWLMDGVVKQHYTVATYFGLVLDSGFEAVLFREWAQRATGSAKWLIPRSVMPAFMMIGSRKRVT